MLCAIDSAVSQPGMGPPIRLVAAHLAAEESQRPEAEDRQVVRARRPADDLGQKVIDGAHADRREPQPEHVVPVPPVGGGLLHPGVHAGQLADDEQQRNPQQRRHHVPDAHIQRLDLAVDQCVQHRADDADETGHDEDTDLPRDLEVFHAIGPARANGTNRAGNAGVDERTAQHHPHGAHQVRAQQARQQPDDDAQGGVGDPAIQHGGQVHRANAPKRLPGLAHQPVGHVQLERSRQPRSRAQQQPKARKRNEHEDRESGGVICLDAVAQRIGIVDMLRLPRPRRCPRRPVLVIARQSRIVDPAQFARRKNHRSGPRVFDQQALAHRPYEDKQPHDREQKRPQQTQYCTVHRWAAFPLGCARCARVC